MKHGSFDIQREKMVAFLKGKGIWDQRVLDAMTKIPRHIFVPRPMQEYAYMDSALSIPCRQTISQPYIVAFMTEAAQLNNDSKVLEIGSGSGYQTAVLAEICREVYTIEIIEQLAKSASALFKTLGYYNINAKIADGHEGWPEKAPFDAIIVTAAAETLPKNLLEQLIVNGHMLIPLKTALMNTQILAKITKISSGNDYTTENLLDVAFVPMVKQHS